MAMYHMAIRLEDPYVPRTQRVVCDGVRWLVYEQKPGEPERLLTLVSLDPQDYVRWLESQWNPAKAPGAQV